MPSRLSQMRNEMLQQQQQNPSFQINEEYLNQLSALMKSKNASQYLVEIASINPFFKSLMQIAQTGNLQPIYENMARQRGVDPNWLVNKLLSNI